ncbi:RluA family pseudouridine synthase [Lactobacillus hominis]|uniref:Pseudouridine synthase n=1 Tax=Lactobacillus hominis DSM 23910 = CRBIP 24.179 TaxID=1423758 RepID=I7L9V2_9LACO|nr:RluA family pseudouridine synthase [Lactobacillus hominis]KRM84458.1 pseudouridylate synthase [Lactobacillus hominis DSM 23910 = CRBIP 24.179]MCT3347933.1 RluA family pseudouridine synthase [Lactobacillus hominis]CCI81704.1 Pseudouridine synthase [Lactobacillus hominis DSM 23910 = CRBIP 24.179]
MQYFKMIFENETPQQLGRFLLKNGFSHRAIINSRHHGGMMLVNHKRRYSKYLLKKGDEIIFILGNEKKNEFLKPTNLPVNIIKETKDYLIVNKPAGVLSIPSRYEDDTAIVNRLLHYFKKQHLTTKPHVITRLDKDTSGLVLVGKNAVAHDRFSRLDKDELVKKYHAIVHGNFSAAELSGQIDKAIGKKDNTVKRYIVADGQKAVTDYQVLDQVKGASLVELRLLTGRTHQIRVHMQAIGHPLFGDPLYGIKDDFKRQALNCFLLKYQDPFSQENIKIEISEPQDMQKLWQQLKNNS